MDSFQLRRVIKELIAMFQEETGEAWSDMHDLLVTAGLDEDIADDIIEELEDES